MSEKVKSRETIPLAPLTMVEDVPHPSTPKLLYAAAFIVNIPQIGVGCTLGWTSPTVPILMKKDSHIIISLAEGTNLTSWLMLGTILGPLLVGATIDNVGRRGSLQTAVAISLVSWIMLGLATSINVLYVARFIAGVSISMMSALSPLFVAEISEVRRRSALTSMVQFMANLGYLICYAVGPFVSFTTLLIICSAPMIAFLLLSLTLNESPYYLVANGKFELARKSIKSYRGCSNVQQELEIIQETVAEDNGCLKSLSSLVTGSQHIKALIISSVLFLFLECSGMIPIASLAEPILMASGVSLSSHYSSMMIGIIKVIAGGLTPFFTSRFGCKCLLMVSSFLISMILCILGVFFFLHKLEYNLDYFSWVPVTCLIAYMSSISIGLAPLPFVVMSEIFSPKVKAAGATISIMLNCTFAYLVILVFSKFSETWYMCFWVFSGITLLAVPYVKFFLPDTRKMTLEDIQEWLKKEQMTFFMK